MKYEYIIWDWNGTLLDDTNASVDAVNDLFDSMKIDRIDIERYRECLDSPIYKFYEHFMDINKVSMEYVIGKYYGYMESHFDEITLSAGARETVEKAKEKGIKQYIFSAAAKSDIIPILQREKIEMIFDGISAASDREIGSKLERGEKMIKDYSINRKKCVLIGDSVHDFKCAENMGVDCILLTCGHQDLPSLKLTGAKLCDCFEDIKAELGL